MSSGNVDRRDYYYFLKGGFCNRRRSKPIPQKYHRGKLPSFAMLSRASGIPGGGRIRPYREGIGGHIPEAIIWRTRKDYLTTDSPNTWSSTFRAVLWPPDRPIHVQIFYLGDALYSFINSTLGIIRWEIVLFLEKCLNIKGDSEDV